MIEDQNGENVITAGSASVTVFALRGTDTIIGGAGPLIVTATSDGNFYNLNSIVIEAQGSLDFVPGDGANTVLGGSGLTNIETGDTISEGPLYFTGGAGAATVNGSLGGTTVTGGPGTVELDQIGSAAIIAGVGIVTVKSDGNPLTVTGADGTGPYQWTPGTHDVVTVVTNNITLATTITDTTSGWSVLLTGGHIVNAIDASAGGSRSDGTGENLIALGSVAATVTASAGTDTIIAGSGALTVNAAGDLNPLVIDAGSANATTILGGSGTISLAQHGATTITPGSGTITVTSDGGALGINGADRKESDAWQVAAGHVVTIRTNGITSATTVTDTATGTSRLLAGGQVINLIDGTAGGTFTDIGGLNRITLGSLAATVQASAGVDTVFGGTGRFTVDASNDVNALTINAGQANGTTVKGGGGTIALAQHGTTAISAGTGTITINADGSSITVAGADSLESSTWSPTVGDVVTIRTDAGTRVTTVTDSAAHRTLRLGGGQALNLVDGTAGGTILDAAGSNLITLGTAAALVTASAGTDTITGGSGALTVDASGNSHALRIVGGSGALTVTPGAGADTVFGSVSGPTRVLAGGTQGTLYYYDDGGSATIAGATQGTSITATSGSITLTQRGDTTIQAGTGPMTVRTNGSRLAITGWGVSTVLDRSWTSGHMLLLGYNGTVTTVTDEQTGDAYTLYPGGPSITGGGLPGPQDPLAGASTSADIGVLRQYLDRVPGQPAHLTYFAPGSAVPTSGIPSLLIASGGAATVTVPTQAAIVRNQIAGTDLEGNGGADQFITSTTSFTYHANGGSGAVLADDNVAGGNAGNNHIVLAPAGGGDFVIVTGSGDDVIEASSGNDTIAAGAGNNAVYLGTGNSVVTSSGNDLVLSGSGAATVEATTGSQVVVFGGPNALDFLGGSGAAATVIGGSGAATMVGGSGTSLFWGSGSGGNIMIAGTGASTLVGGGSGNVLRAEGSANEVLIAGTGNSTLLGGSATGSNMYLGSGGADLIATDLGSDLVIGGPGYDTLEAGGGSALIFGGSDGNVLVAPPSGGTVNFISDGQGANTFEFINGQGGGIDIIWGFRPGVDQFSLQGYGGDEASNANANAHPYGAGTELFLSDGTRVVFGDVSLPQNGFG